MTENESLNNYLAGKRSDAQSKAQAYLAKKDRKTYYVFSGSHNYDGDDSPCAYYYEYTPEQIAHIAQLSVDVYNKEFASENPVTTFEAMLNDIAFAELPAYDSELDEVIARCEDDNMYLEKIALPPRHRYAMSYFCWHQRSKKMSPQCPFLAELTDDEYLYLLTEQLADRELFTFNCLQEMNPELAVKISDEADGNIGGGIMHNGMPFMVLLDEVLADVEAIDGPVPDFVELYDGDTDNHLHHVIVNTNNRQMTLMDEEVRNDIPEVNGWLGEIDADVVMQRLQASDYPDMLQKLADRFKGPSSFADMKAWLDAEKIIYKEK